MRSGGEGVVDELTLRVEARYSPFREMDAPVEMAASEGETRLATRQSAERVFVPQ